NRRGRGSGRRRLPPARRRRAPSAASLRGQPDDEAGARHRRLAVLVDRPSAVLRPDAPTMGLDDLLGDGKPEARVLAKALVRAVGVEALEDALQRIVPDAGT